MKHFRQQIIPAPLTVVAVCMTATTATAGPGSYNQQGPKLVGTGAVGARSQQGLSVALSADGNTALVGAPGHNPISLPGFAVGAAWVFTRSNHIWSQQGQKLVGKDANFQGGSVALSGDGNTAVVGADGGAFVFTRSGSMWTQQGPLLVGTGQVSGTVNVAISGDGNTLAEGNQFDSTGSGGQVFVFTRSGRRMEPAKRPDAW